MGVSKRQSEESKRFLKEGPSKASKEAALVKKGNSTAKSKTERRGVSLKKREDGKPKKKKNKGEF